MEAPSKTIILCLILPGACSGVVVIGRDQTAPDFGRASWNWYFGICFPLWKKKTWLTIMREEKCACLQTCGLQIAYNSHITVCHQNTSAWRDQSYCHPFTFNFNLHEIMFFLLHFFQFFSSPPLFIFPYHFKVPPFSNVIFFGCNVLHLCTSIIFISSLCPL